MERGEGDSHLLSGGRESPVRDANGPLELPGEGVPGLLSSPRERKAVQGPRIKIE